MTWNKIKGIIKIQTKEELAYRFDFFVWSLMIPSFILIQYFLWNAVFKASSQVTIRGFTFSGMISYYILVLMVEIITNAHIHTYISENIRSGKLLLKFIMPVRFMKFLLIKTLGERIFACLIFIPVITVLGIILTETSITIINFLLFIPSVIMSFILTFFFSFAIGLSSFWIVEIAGIRKIWHGVREFLGGAIIPLTFFPTVFQNIFEYLPFQYFLYVPVQIILGNFTINEIISKLIIQFVWVLIIYLIILLVWKKAYAKFTGVGT